MASNHLSTRPVAIAGAATLVSLVAGIAPVVGGWWQSDKAGKASMRRRQRAHHADLQHA